MWEARTVKNICNIACELMVLWWDTGVCIIINVVGCV